MTERNDIELSDYLPYLINRVGSALVARYEVELKRYGLSIAMWRVMVALSHGGSQRQIDIAEMTSIDVSTLSRLVTRMIRMGIVSRTRSDTNNREVTVELTAKGRAQLNRLVPIGRATGTAGGGRIVGRRPCGDAGGVAAHVRQSRRADGGQGAARRPQRGEGARQRLNEFHSLI